MTGGALVWRRPSDIKSASMIISLYARMHCPLSDTRSRSRKGPAVPVVLALCESVTTQRGPLLALALTLTHPAHTNTSLSNLLDESPKDRLRQALLPRHKWSVQTCIFY
eukprot:scpid73644/ scgid31428/ 